MHTDRRELMPPRELARREPPARPPRQRRRLPAVPAAGPAALAARLAVVAARLAVVAALAWALAAPAAHADDRSLLHSTQQNPYVFIILDTSGSMHQSTACSATDIAAGNCSELCVDGDCLPHLMGDDPNSKIYTAKQAIYKVMQLHPTISFGFGHFDQAGMHMSWKYWWYQVASAQPNGFITLDSGLHYPEPGQLEVFGEQAWNCTDARADLNGTQATPLRWTGCPFTGKNNVTGTQFPIAGQPTTPQPAHLDNAWEWERVRRYPKLNDDNSQTFWYYIQEKTGGTGVYGEIYRVTFTPVTVPAQTLGQATMQVKISVDRCTNAQCSTTTAATGSPRVMTFDKANEMVYWEPGEGVTQAPSDEGTPPNGGGAFFGNAAREIGAAGNAPQLDMNYNAGGLADTANDQGIYLSDSSAPVVTTDPRGKIFWTGDFIPLDWTTNQQTAIMNRMAPNLLGGAMSPDFSIADYFADHRVNGEPSLRLKNAAQGPLAPDGGTPTGHVMLSYLNWLQGTAAPPTPTGWIQAAAAASGDPFFSCKPMYVLLVTDGQASGSDGSYNSNNPLNTCKNYYNWVNPQVQSGSLSSPGYACCVASQLRNYVLPGSGVPGTPYPIKTYVVGLGLTTLQLGTFNNTLQCVADEGGTGNRHFYQGNPNTYSSANPGYPKSDKPADLANFCCSAADFNATPPKCSPLNPCDGPGPLLPTNPQSVAAALESIISKIQSEAAAFASAAVPSIQSNVQNKELITQFSPINQPIWPGRVDAFSDPVPTHTVPVVLPDGSPATATVPDTRCSAACSSPTQQGCHIWNAGGGKPPVNLDPVCAQTPDTILAQGLNGLDTAGTDPSKRRIYYAPQTPIVAGELRLSFQMPAPADTAHLYDLENALGICGPGYYYYPTTSGAFTQNSPSTCPAGQTAAAAPPVTPYNTAQQAVAFTEAIKSYLNPQDDQTYQYLLGDIFHSDPQVLGQPANVVLFEGNVNGYQAFANAERFRRKVLYFGSNDGELHALDAGTVQQGTVGGKPAWTFGNGTGNELFAFIPRTVMPTLNQLAIANAPPLNGGSQTFMVDGPVHLTEGYFDATGGTNPCPQTNPPAACQWHSLVIGGLREGGHGYYALDVTQPDTLTSDHETPGDTTSPAIQLPNPSPVNYLPNCLDGGANCAQLPYATPLWEFTDACKVSPSCASNCQLKPCDADVGGPGAGQPDLGETWSRPNSGRVRICDPGCATFHDQWVVVFGGGMDPGTNNSQGNWLYMLDMATGKVLYKRQLNGSVPSEPAAVDTGQDGYIDTIYIGTTAGHLYKVDLTSPAPIDSATGRVSAGNWRPFEIFDTQGRQVYYPPAVFFDTDRNQFGLAWGTGNRFDLWKSDVTSGRFYVLIDTGFTAANTATPHTAADLQQLTPDGALNPASNFLLSPTAGLLPGYYFEMGQGERVINQAFALSGVLIFGSYVPKPITAASNGNTVCADTGDTHVFVLNINNGDAISSQVATEGTAAPANGSGGSPTNRYFVLAKDLGIQINTKESTPIAPTPPAAGPSSPPAPAAPVLSAAIKDVIGQIMKLMPRTCRFATKRIDITVTDTFNTTFPVAAVPACIIEKNWKEF